MDKNGQEMWLEDLTYILLAKVSKQVVAEQVYGHIEKEKLLPNEQNFFFVQETQ